jgi:N-acetyl-anhydromuramyl-L-alanine amidase AmpD
VIVVDRILDAWRRAGGRPVTGHVEPPGWLTIDEDGWLDGDRVELYPSVRSSPLTSTDALDGSPRPCAIVWHYTATKVGSGRGLAKRIRAFDRVKDRAASWHVLVTARGELLQSVSFERGSWHCSKGTIDGHRMNRCTVGVELEGYGETFPQPQQDAAERLLAVLVERYGIPRDEAGLGHRDFDPTRRADPGDVWAALLPAMIDRASARKG